jgi:hypothetical protein
MTIFFFPGAEPQPVSPLEPVRKPAPHDLHGGQVSDLAQQGQAEAVRVSRGAGTSAGAHYIIIIHVLLNLSFEIF